MIYNTGNVVSFETEQSLPSGETDYVLEVFKGNHVDRMAYWKFAEPDNAKEKTNRMFGYPHHSDGRLELICECISIGDHEFQQLDYFSETQKTAIQSKWVLLLQLDSNTDLDMQFGDLDCFYFWISKVDLANKNFENTIAFSMH